MWLLVASCKKPVAEAPPEPAEEVPSATPAPATPLPAPPPPAKIVAEATPAPNYLAPPGVYFLIAQASITTASGITGLPPGTQLQQSGPDEYTAPGGYKLKLRADQVTNDLRIAQHLAGADLAAQNALRRMHAPRSAASSATAPSAPIVSAPATASIATPTPRPKIVPGGGGVLGATHTRVKDGYIWEKNRDGVWVRTRPVGN